MGVCSSYTRAATSLPIGNSTLLTLTVIDTPDLCVGYPTQAYFIGTRFWRDTDAVNIAGQIFAPSDGLHGGPPVTAFFSNERVTVTLVGRFSSAAAAGVIKVVMGETPGLFTTLFPPVAGGGGGGCDYTHIGLNTPFPVVLTGTRGTGLDPLTFAVTTPPAHGSFSGSGANLTYTPNAGFAGTDTFTYTVNDGSMDSLPVINTICVFPYALHAPVTTPISGGGGGPGGGGSGGGGGACFVLPLPGMTAASLTGCAVKK
jgi:Big-like domain-containing protein